MTAPPPSQLLISEVGPRDGLQSLKTIMPTAAKCRWIDALAAAGIQEIEVASFVPAKLLPQMADAAEVVRYAKQKTGVTVVTLVPNVKSALAAIAAGADEVGLSDTVGYANPQQVRRMFTRLRSEIGHHAGAAHLHNTCGLGLANCLAAWDVGVTTFDASLAGLGGCPYAPGASGNVVTEDLVFMFEAMGVATGIDWHRLSAARTPLAQALPDEPLYGMTPDCGLPKDFGQHGQHAP